MNQLMTGLFDLACDQVYGEMWNCKITEDEDQITASDILGEVRLTFFKHSKEFAFRFCNELLHINQYPLYERYFEYLERGV